VSFLFWMECRGCHAQNKVEARKRYLLDEGAEVFVPCLFPVEDERCYKCGKALAKKNQRIKSNLARVEGKGVAGRNCFV
jgi:hypothetical protein